MWFYFWSAAPQLRQNVSTFLLNAPQVLQNISSACFCGGGGGGACCGGGRVVTETTGADGCGPPSQDETYLPKLSVKDPAKIIIMSINHQMKPTPQKSVKNN